MVTTFQVTPKQEVDEFRILAVMIEQISVERAVLLIHFQNENAFHLEKNKRKDWNLKEEARSRIENNMCQLSFLTPGCTFRRKYILFKETKQHKTCK